MRDIKVKTRIIMGYSFTLFANVMMGVIGVMAIINAQTQTPFQIRLAIGFIILLTIGTILSSVIAASRLIRIIANPVAELTKAANQLAVGDVDVTISDHDYKDEIAELVEAFRKMVFNIDTETNIVREIAKGNLQLDVTPHSEKDILGIALKEILDDYNNLLAAMKESTSQFTVGAGQVASASQALAQGSTEQASAIEQITASMNDIAEKTSMNASQAGEVDKIAHNVAEEAEAGNEKMQEMVVAMKEINKSSMEISKIIKTIDDIAFQTNILALNATVEAARAGVHGKGFAVVAEEVRNLAEKSALAANETNDMINDSIQKVHNGSDLAKETAITLEGIVNSIEKTAELIENISVATNNQATAVMEINQGLGQVSQVVQNNSASSEECAASSEELANQAEVLNHMLSKYQLKNTERRLVASDVSGNDWGGKSSVRRDNESLISLEGDFGKY